MRAHRSVAVAVLLVAAAVAGEAGLADVPVVVVVDTSRSLSAAEVGQAGARIGEAVRALPADTPAGLVEFNDAARWLVPLGARPAAVATALGNLRPAGSHSVIRDALVVASQAMPRGGVILLVTDGKDEDSAATASDLGQVLAARNVRVFALGQGRSLDARALRRVSLLSGGEYLGLLQQSPATEVAAALGRARAALAPTFPDPVVAAPPAPVAAPAAVEPPAPPARPVWPFWLIGAGLAAAAFAAVLAWRARRSPAQRICPDCEREMAEWETACSFCTLDRAQLERVGQGTPQAAAHELREGSDDPARMFEASMFEKAPSTEQLERTFALQEKPMLVVRQGKRGGRSYALDGNRVVGVGRAHVNTIVVEDPTVSAQHFKIVPKEGEYYVLDLGSTNGTVVNGQRTRVHRLEAGDVISTGQVEIEFRIEYSRPTASSQQPGAVF